MAFDPITLGIGTAASAAGSILKNRAANEDFIKQTQNAVKEANARTAFGNQFLADYSKRYGDIANQNYANENERLTSRLGAIQPTVAAYDMPAQEAERGGLQSQRINFSDAAMGPAASSSAIPLGGGMGVGQTAADYAKRFGASAAAGKDAAARGAALGSWNDIWNRNALRMGETNRGLGVAEAIGKGRSDVINQAARTNERSLSALPALSELVGYQNRSAPVVPASTTLADILSGAGTLTGAIAGVGGPSALFGNSATPWNFFGGSTMSNARPRVGPFG